MKQFKPSVNQRKYWKCSYCKFWDDSTEVCNGVFKGVVRTDPDFACNQYEKMAEWSIEGYNITREQVKAAQRNGLSKWGVRERIRRWKDVERAVNEPKKKCGRKKGAKVK